MSPADRPRIAVLDYGAANMVSISQALVACGADVVIAPDPAALGEVDAIVIPGVAAAAAAMRSLDDRGLIEPLRTWAGNGRPLLGICLGFQIMFDRSDEGDVECLGLLRGRVALLEDAPSLPHIGWNSVEPVAEHPLFEGIPDGSHFYFVHSYAAVPADDRTALARTSHGRPFVSAASQGSIYGVQFHPEKSGEMGLRLLANFVRLVEEAA